MNTAKTATFEPCGAISASIQPPGSKSLTNRAIVCAALAKGQSRLTGVLDSEDTQVMVEAWRELGLELTHDKESRTLEVVGCGGSPPKREADLFVANSGTTIRFSVRGAERLWWQISTLWSRAHALSTDWRSAGFP